MSEELHARDYINILCHYRTYDGNSRPVLGAFAKLRKATTSFVMFDRPHATSRLSLNGFIWNLNIRRFLEIYRKKFKCGENLKRITGNLHEDLCKCMTISRWLFFRINISDKSCVERQNIQYILYRANVVRKSCRLWGNVEKAQNGWAINATDDDIIRRKNYASFMPED